MVPLLIMVILFDTAINISFTKQAEKFYIYISNPKTNGKTHFKYEVDQHFLVKYNNPALEEMYN